MSSCTVERSSAVSTVHEGRRCTETQVCLAVQFVTVGGVGGIRQINTCRKVLFVV
jgi:hypothetical protein